MAGFDVRADRQRPDLSLTTGKTGAEVHRDLKAYSLVQVALQAYNITEIDPVVIDENTGKPYWKNLYIKKFRMIRDAAGVPSHVWSMDTRPGAVPEKVRATGLLESSRELATHTSTKMSAKYNRGTGIKNNRVIQLARIKERSDPTE